jgi:hypothetical protein
MDAYHNLEQGMKMAPPKGKKGALEEQVKDVLVMMHFLAKGNSPSYAEQIRRSWDRHHEGNIVTWLPREIGPRQKSLSLAGTIQVCERLSSPERGILQRHTTVFGKKRTVVTYTLSETPEGFRKVARAMLGISPFFFLRSTYANHCLDNVWIPEIMGRLGSGSSRVKEFDWALKHLPTALMMTLEKDFGSRSEKDWYSINARHDELAALAGACAIVDATSPSRSFGLARRGDFIRFSVQAQIEGRDRIDLRGEGRIGLRRNRPREVNE